MVGATTAVAGCVSDEREWSMRGEEHIGDEEMLKLKTVVK